MCVLKFFRDLLLFLIDVLIFSFHHEIRGLIGLLLAIPMDILAESIMSLDNCFTSSSMFSLKEGSSVIILSYSELEEGEKNHFLK